MEWLPKPVPAERKTPLPRSEVENMAEAGGRATSVNEVPGVYTSRYENFRLEAEALRRGL